MRAVLWSAVAAAVVATAGCGGGTTGGDDAGAPLDAAPGADASPDAGGDDARARDDDADDDGYPIEDDCDDGDPAVNPGATETCDLRDEDCDTRVDEGTTSPFYPDLDADGHGDATAAPVDACSAREGHVVSADDCDDADGMRFPGQIETCNVYDDDCDEIVDEEAVDARTYFADADADGYGDTSATLASCALLPPLGYSDLDTDCAPADPTIHPGADEVCDAIDQDCDLIVDESATDATTLYRDADGDTYGTDGTTVRACGGVTGFVAVGGDCDDSPGAGFAVNPGAIDEPDASAVDADCDGVDGDRATAVFVAPPGTCGCTDGSGAGSITTPFCSIRAALTAAGASRDVLVANGMHPVAATVEVPSGAEIYGGYNCAASWARAPSVAATTIVATAPIRVTMQVSAPGEDVVLDRLAIVGPDMTSIASAESIALLVSGSAAMDRVRVVGTRLIGGRGGPGAAGAAGGVMACDRPGGYPGGSVRCVGGPGGWGAAGDGAAFGGAAGAGGSSYCPLACATYGTTSISDGGRGGDGGNSHDAGVGASVSPDQDGAMTAAGDWIPISGTAGTRGGDGGGGGGGGAGGWKSQRACGGCAEEMPGGSGGAGGRGGCGGAPGQPGGQGGASIGLLLVGSRVRLIDAAIERGAGGVGGAGGAGGMGERGYGGGPGGPRSSDGCGRESGAGGPGGRGGDGGGGSGGAGGNGGPSLCVARVGASGIDGIGDVSLICTGSSTGAAGGLGGAGGLHSSAGTRGGAGPNGLPGATAASVSF